MTIAGGTGAVEGGAGGAGMGGGGGSGAGVTIRGTIGRTGRQSCVLGVWVRLVPRRGWGARP